MSKTVRRNVLWNWAGMLSGMFTGFVVAPFLVHRLGETTYGLWILALAFASSLGLLDLGLRASIGRHLSLYHARQDEQRFRSVVATARIILMGAALIALAATLILQQVFPHLFHVPTDQAGRVRAAVLMIGLSVVWTLAMGLYDATLWAYERFDLINAVEVFASVAQAVAAIVLIRCGYSILALSIGVLAVAIFRESAKYVACLKLRKRPAPRAKADWQTAKLLFHFAIWNSLWTIGARLTSQCVSMVVGARINAASVTPFNVATSLTNYARSFVSTGTGVLIPVATAMHATQRRADQRRLFIEGSRYSWFLALLLTMGLLLLGKQFIGLWMGPALLPSASLLFILIVGEALPMSQGIATSFLMAMNRQRILAASSMLEAVAIFALGIAFAKPGGLTGICYIIAICGLIFRGIVPMLYTCRALDLSFGHYLFRSLLPPLSIAIGPATAFAIVIHQRPPSGWFELILYSGAVGGSLLLLGWWLLPSDERNAESEIATDWQPAGIAESA